MADLLDWPGRIQRLRAQRGWTQEVLARVLGCAKGSVGNWEGGHGVPSGARRRAFLALEAEGPVLPAPTLAPSDMMSSAAPVTAFQISTGRCPVCLEYKVASVALTSGVRALPALCFTCTLVDAILRTPERTLRLLRHQERATGRSVNPPAP